MSALLLGLRRHSPSFLRPLRSYSARTQKELDPQLDGYPQLPDISRQTLPPRGWWDNQMRRNFGDTVCQSFLFFQRASCLFDVRCMSAKRCIPCGVPIFPTSIPPPPCATSLSPSLASSRLAYFATTLSCQSDLPSRVNFLSMAS